MFILIIQWYLLIRFQIYFVFIHYYKVFHFHQVHLNYELIWVLMASNVFLRSVHYWLSHKVQFFLLSTNLEYWIQMENQIMEHHLDSNKVKMKMKMMFISFQINHLFFLQVNQEEFIQIYSYSDQQLILHLKFQSLFYIQICTTKQLSQTVVIESNKLQYYFQVQHKQFHLHCDVQSIQDHCVLHWMKQ
jgi:hypothetical protein